MCISKASSHACNAVIILLPNMVKAILAWLFVFQAIDFKTAKYLTGLEYCTGRIRTRENIVFFDKALINVFFFSYFSDDNNVI